jgi:hypothetical protein
MWIFSRSMGNWNCFAWNIRLFVGANTSRYGIKLISMWNFYRSMWNWKVYDNQYNGV